MSPPPIQRLPDALLPLANLALDLRWTWSHAGDALWRRMDESLWETTGNPWLMLQVVPTERLRALAADPAFVTAMDRALEERKTTLGQPGWFRQTHSGRLGAVAYFSMEFGLHEALPLYAGGLGILAGDHLKTASDLDVPLVAVGILWQRGFFRQTIDPEGHQLELHPHNDPATLPLRQVFTAEGDPLPVELELPGRRIRLRAWSARVGRVHLYLLDANHPLNAPADRGITDTLYPSDPDVSLFQQLVLGIGGWRLLEALGLDVEVCHLNEGHAAFAVLERAGRFMSDHGVSFREALWATRAGNVFTTHTPVAAGLKSFDRAIVDRYSRHFQAYVARLGLSWPDVLALGRADPEDASEPFSMAFLALRGCARVNGVSRLHGAVSRSLFRHLFPRWPEREVPVGHITNGVHVPSWDTAGSDELWTAASGKDRWRGELEALDEEVAARPDEEIWKLRCDERADLVRWCRMRLRRQRAQRGEAEADLEALGGTLDPGALTLGFARRFTAYKRPNLLLQDRTRLERLLLERNVQLVVAGKAHPSDEEGKRMITEWVRFARRPEVRRHVAFIEDYDMTVAREMVQGVDVWVNTPRRPWEASGTSGMKVLVNGGLNLSELDGWWAEAYAPGVGWALPEPGPGPASEQDARQAEGLYRLLEEEIVPLFEERDEAGLPRRWIALIRESMANLTPRFSSNRMVRDYVERAYLPAAEDYRARVADGRRFARELAAWEERIRGRWPGVRFGGVSGQRHGTMTEFFAKVFLAGLTPNEVRVELYAEPVEPDAPPVIEPMVLDDGAPQPPDGRVAWMRYRAVVETDRPVEHFTPRVFPWHRRARLPTELPRIVWAR